MEVTGLALKVGDWVRRATTPAGSVQLTGQPRTLGDMEGEVIAFQPARGSGSGRKTGKARVQWSSGSISSHDADMLVRSR